MRLLVALASVAVACSPLAAQVGHSPESSPYQDIRFAKFVSLLYGDIGGDGGKVGVGPHHGQSYGARFDIRLSGPLQAGLSFAQADLERLVIDADAPVATRVKGPVGQQLTLLELALQWNITGRKTWHRLAPYVTGAIGVATSTDTPSDTSGYSFGTKVYLSPGIGFRLFLSDRIHLRAEARQLFWKLSYPSSYFQAPAADTTAAPVLSGGSHSQWTGGRELRVGLGIGF
jgi:hypothetical protein